MLSDYTNTLDITAETTTTMMIVRHGRKTFNMTYIQSFKPKQSPPFDINGRVRPTALPKADLEITEGNLIITGMAHTENGTHENHTT